MKNTRRRDEWRGVFKCEGARTQISLWALSTRRQKNKQNSKQNSYSPTNFLRFFLFLYFALFPFVNKMKKKLLVPLDYRNHPVLSLSGRVSTPLRILSWMVGKSDSNQFVIQFDLTTVLDFSFVLTTFWNPICLVKNFIITVDREGAQKFDDRVSIFRRLDSFQIIRPSNDNRIRIIATGALRLFTSLYNNRLIYNRSNFFSSYSFSLYFLFYFFSMSSNPQQHIALFFSSFIFFIFCTSQQYLQIIYKLQFFIP